MIVDGGTVIIATGPPRVQYIREPVPFLGRVAGKNPIIMVMGRPGFIPGPAGRGRGPGAEAVEVAYPRAGLYVKNRVNAPTD